MLKTTESRTITATSSVEQKQSDGTMQDTIVANMSASVEADGSTSVNAYVYDPSLLEKNKETVVADIVAFVKNVYGVEE